MADDLSNLRRGLARKVLRGPALKAWLRRKLPKLEARYLQELIDHSTLPLAQPTSPTGSAPRPPLRRLLLIADVLWERRELVPELEKLAAVTVLDLQPALAGASAGRDSRRQTVIREIESFQQAHSGFEPDAILFYARSQLLSDEAFHLIRRRWSCPLLGMNLDDKLEFLDYGLFSDPNDGYQRWAGQFDLNLSSVRAVVDWYADAGLPVCYLPEGFAPRFTGAPREHEPFEHGLAFIGSRRPEREEFMERLAAAGLEVTCFGSGWPGTGRVDSPEEIFRASQVNLGIGLASPSQELVMLKGRDFECPGAGGCYLTTFNWELALHFEIGREILCYRSVDELVEVFCFHRRRPQTCRQIGQAALRRCLAEHTWEQRFRGVFRELGFRPPKPG